MNPLPAALALALVLLGLRRGFVWTFTRPDVRRSLGSMAAPRKRRRGVPELPAAVVAKIPASAAAGKLAPESPEIRAWAEEAKCDAEDVVMWIAERSRKDLQYVRAVDGFWRLLAFALMWVSALAWGGGASVFEMGWSAPVGTATPDTQMVAAVHAAVLGQLLMAHVGSGDGVRAWTVTVELVTRLSLALLFPVPAIAASVLHDITEAALEASKIAETSNRQNVSTGLFLGFFASWFALRIVLFPRAVWGWYSTAASAGASPTAALLGLCLLVLDARGFSVIARVARRSFWGSPASASIATQHDRPLDARAVMMATTARTSMAHASRPVRRRRAGEDSGVSSGGFSYEYDSGDSE